jgi:hypothetical protein
MSFLHHEHLKTRVILKVFISFSLCIQITVLAIHSELMQGYTVYITQLHLLYKQNYVDAANKKAANDTKQ